MRADTEAGSLLRFYKPKESSAAVLPWKGHLVTMGTFGNGLGCRNAKRLQPDARQNDLRPTC